MGFHGGFNGDFMGILMGFNSSLLKMAIEIVDLPSYKMVIFHSFLYVYQAG